MPFNIGKLLLENIAHDNLVGFEKPIKVFFGNIRLAAQRVQSAGGGMIRQGVAKGQERAAENIGMMPCIFISMRPSSSSRKRPNQLTGDVPLRHSCP